MITKKARKEFVKETVDAIDHQMGNLQTEVMQDLVDNLMGEVYARQRGEDHDLEFNDFLDLAQEIWDEAWEKFKKRFKR